MSQINEYDDDDDALNFGILETGSLPPSYIQLYTKLAASHAAQYMPHKARHSSPLREAEPRSYMTDLCFWHTIFCW